MKCLYIYNPVSGKGKAEKTRKYVCKKLAERFGEVDAYATSAPGELYEKAAEACGVYDVLVFAGGDGSFNEVINGLGEREDRPVLGYIPTGTVNDIARSVGIKRKVRSAVRNIVSGGAYPLDVMKVNDSYAMYVACSGGLTGCSYTADQNAKKKMGKFAYALEVLKHDLIFDEYPISFEGDNVPLETEAVMVMIMNGRSVASFPVNRGSKMDDGEVEVIIVHPRRRKRETKVHKHFRYFFNVLGVFARGFRKLGRRRRRYYTHKCKSFSVTVPDDVIWNLDGERGPLGKLSVEVLPRHVDLIIPRPKRGRRSCLTLGRATCETLLAKENNRSGENDEYEKRERV